jgi:hypothetical protein
MTELDILIDGELRERAIAAAEQYVRQYPECEVKPAQIAGLRQLAGMEPGCVPGFAAQQRDRAQKRAAGSNNPRHGREAAFWDLIHKLCNSGPTRDLPWTLHTAYSADLQQASPGSNKERQAFKECWIDSRYPPFFQAFCIHYLYRRAETAPAEEDDRD